jgi:hypothetical protein
MAEYTRELTAILKALEQIAGELKVANAREKARDHQRLVDRKKSG